MEDHLIGESAAIIVAVLWTACSILFASAGRRIGALSVNAIRLVFAVLLLSTAHLIIFGTYMPDANNAQYGYMALSGVIGLALGDFGYFGTLVILGPRKGVLLMSMAPIFSAISAYFILDEVLGAWTIVGIALTLAGVMIVVMERVPDPGEENAKESPKGKMDEGKGNDHHRRTVMIGVLMGLGGAVGQGLGLVVSKYGMINAASDGADPLDPLSATLIRMVAAVIFVWISVAMFGKLPTVLGAMKNRPAMKRTFAGAATGPFMGVWLSMIAVSYTVAGVAATLMATMPLIVIPVVWFLYGERTNARGVIGAVVAFVGVAILFLL